MKLKNGTAQILEGDAVPRRKGPPTKTIRVFATTAEHLEAVAKAAGRTVAQYIHLHWGEYLEAEAMSAKKDLKRLHKRYGSEDVAEEGPRE